MQVPGTQWEYKEVDRTTGKPKRVVFEVPMLLNPNEPSDWNYRYGQDNGEIIVAQGNAEPADIIFTGEPTPDMMPLDDEAKKISAGFATKWKHPIETLPNSYAEHILDGLQKEVADVRSKAASAAPAEGMSELLAAMTTMMKQNQELLLALTSRPIDEAEPKAARRA